MNSKTCLTFLGLLLVLAVLASAENHEESSLSEELGSSRVARSADAEAARRKRKTLRKRKRTQKKNKTAKKGQKKRTKKNKTKRRQNKTKRTQNKRRKGIRQSTRMGEIDGMCLESAVTAMKRWKDVVANFEKQKTRIEKQATIASKKSVKQ